MKRRLHIVNLLLLFVGLFCAKSELIAQPCLEGWRYRSTVELTHLGQTLTDYQIELSIDMATLISQGKMQFDGADIRLMSEEGVLLPHWVEEQTLNSSDATVWVRVPVVDVGSHRIYMFYGNMSAANISSGESTFVFFDDFNSLGLDQSNWVACGDGDFNFNNSSVLLETNSGQRAELNSNIIEGIDWVVMSEVDGVTGGGGLISIQKGNRRGYSLYYEEGPSTMRLRRRSVNSACGDFMDQTPSTNSVTAGVTSGNWEIAWPESGTQFISWPGSSVNPIERNESNVTRGTNTRVSVGQHDFAGGIQLNWIALRKYAEAIPVTEVLFEEGYQTEPVVTSNSPLCEGESLQLESNLDEGTLVSWTGPNGFASDEVAIDLVNANPENSGSYVMTIFNPLTCANEVRDVDVRVDQTTVAGSLSGSATVCALENSGTISLNAAIGIPTRWEFSETGFEPWLTIQQTDEALDYEQLNDPMHVRAIVQNGVCEVQISDTAHVLVDSPSEGGVILEPLPVCSGENEGVLQLTVHRGEVLGWHVSSDDWNSFVTIDSSTVLLGFEDLIETTKYRAVVQNGVCPTEMSSVATVLVNPLPEVTFDVANVCDQDTAQFTNTTTLASGQLNSFLWDFGDGSNSVDEHPVKIYNSPGVYLVRLSAESEKGCVASGEQEVRVYIRPNAHYEVSSVCFGEVSEFENETQLSEGSFSSYWDFADGESSELTSPVHRFELPGIYTVLLRVESNFGCVDSTAEFVQVFTLPQVNAGPDTVVSYGFRAMLLGSAEGVVNWTPDDDLNNGGVLNPIAGPLETTIYSLTVTDDHGCQQTDQMQLVVNLDYKLTVSNVITPDNNGENDYWHISNIESFDNAKVYVFNRAGQEVFFSDQYANDWNGVNQKDILPDGTYYYLITFDESEVIYKGAISIFRNR